MTHTYTVRYPYKSLSTMFPAYRNFGANSSTHCAVEREELSQVLSCSLGQIHHVHSTVTRYSAHLAASSE